MKIRCLLAGSWLGIASIASAQNCGGMPAVNGVCIPPDSPTSPLNSTYGQQRPAQPHQPVGKWRLTWGAIASDSVTGDIGVVTGESSQEKAKRAAINKCKASGATRCKIDLAYHNQCAAIASPADGGLPIPGVVINAGGPSIEVASEDAMEHCSAARGGGECTVIYSACSTPVWVQK